MTLYTSARHPWSLDIERSLMLTVTQGILSLGNLRGPMTFTPVAKRLAVELLLPV